MPWSLAHHLFNSICLKFSIQPFILAVSFHFKPVPPLDVHSRVPGKLLQLPHRGRRIPSTEKRNWDGNFRVPVFLFSRVSPEIHFMSQILHLLQRFPQYCRHHYGSNEHPHVCLLLDGILLPVPQRSSAPEGI